MSPDAEADSLAWSPARGAALRRAPLVALNYHDIPAKNRGAVSRRLRRAAEVGPSWSAEEEAADGPRLFVGFYDGYRDATLFGTDLCHRLGIRAVVFPVFSCPDPARGTLREDDLADLATAHEIGFHSSSHAGADEVGPDDVEREVDDPVSRIVVASGRTPRIGAWKGGSRFDAALPGNRRLAELGVRWLLSNWSVEPIPDGSVGVGGGT